MAAYCYYIQAIFGWLRPSDAKAQEGLRLAYLAAEKAEDDAEALWMAGRTIATLSGDVDHGFALVEPPLLINPNSARALWMSGMFYACAGQVQAALERFERARRLNPLDPSRHAHWLGVALAYFFGGRYALAKEAIDKALAEWPESTPGLEHKAAICGMLGEIEEGRNCIRQRLAVDARLDLATVRQQLAPRLRGNALGLDRYVEGLRRCWPTAGNGSSED